MKIFIITLALAALACTLQAAPSRTRGELLALSLIHI